MIEIGAIERLSLGDHACVVFEDDETRTRTLAAYIQAGLRRRHRILYFGGEPGEVEAALAGQGTDPRSALAAGQLRMATVESTYLAAGHFDPLASIEGWRAASAEALAAGYRGLRAVGDMSWGATAVPGADQLPWYEANVNRVFADGYAMGLCLYDRRLFSDADLRRVCWAHPVTVDDDTDPQAVPLLRAVRTTRPAGIRFEGEADLSNRQAMRAILDHLVEDMPGTGEPLVVDISGLRFVDGATIRMLIDAAARAADRLRVVGCSPHMQRLLAFNGADATTGLIVEPACPHTRP
ncbi:MEDS domain-containing protein [Actinoplanes aureus]|uniref:MEDS domain-containing protein n=1 Tax=Actinoplanes aureus TaxID=2792083 RepID=A0A931C3F7_9ACTN|nr:MEDS domain-containing protein [Actinoplanes aureus]MBG0561514.1 MEDS domain-containing protein [Actinoplanes aureus]